MSAVGFPQLHDDDPRIVRLAEDVRDMGNRVMIVLGRNPGDRHYAIDKLHRAFESAAKALIEELDVDAEQLVEKVNEIVGAR